jgi:hypothetical protein
MPQLLVNAPRQPPEAYNEAKTQNREPTEWISQNAPALPAAVATTRSEVVRLIVADEVRRRLTQGFYHLLSDG